MKIPAKLKLVEYTAIGINQLICKNKHTNQIANVLYNEQLQKEWVPVRLEMHVDNICVANYDKFGLIRVLEMNELIFNTIGGAFGVNAPDEKDIVLGYFDTKEEASDFMKKIFFEKEYYLPINMNNLNNIIKNDFNCFIDGKTEMSGSLTEEGDYNEFKVVKPKLVNGKIIIYL